MKSNPPQHSSIWGQTPNNRKGNSRLNKEPCGLQAHRHKFPEAGPSRPRRLWSMLSFLKGCGCMSTHLRPQDSQRDSHCHHLRSRHMTRCLLKYHRRIKYCMPVQVQDNTIQALSSKSLSTRHPSRNCYHHKTHPNLAHHWSIILARSRY